MDDLISRSAAIETVRKAKSIGQAHRMLEQLPSAQPDIIRCKDCKHRGETPIDDGRYWCDIHDTFMYYCSDAERRTDG